ncbi:hypothetical protein [Mycobacteroides chelonae]|uniref:hypothetical protein n=1 Tax=Mycobacteroides chelonae TaxID=1774 RepID=UPI0004AB6A23|nr:hypothetical protein [Mycobacteroides chelonae]OHT67816.1 hypothetical protein BKG66_24640 [Mycobacteroides chelonae]OHT69459.1 hypothetical protein BKG67_23175 [Mycobacteroides chelonae]
MSLHPHDLYPIRDMLRFILAELKKINEREEKRDKVSATTVYNIDTSSISKAVARLTAGVFPQVLKGDFVNLDNKKWEVSKIDGEDVYLKREQWDYVGRYWLSKMINIKDVVPWV